MRAVITKGSALRVGGALVLLGLGSIAAFAGSGSAVPPKAPKFIHGALVAPASFDGSVRRLPHHAHGSRLFAAPLIDRDEALAPQAQKQPLPGATTPPAPTVPVISAPAPDPSISFKGLFFGALRSGWPPDTVGDVGPNHYVEAVNDSVGIFRKSDGFRLAAFNLNDFYAQASPVTDVGACSVDEGDPTVVYDPLGDRWIVADFAFSGSTPSSPPFYECIAVSKTGDPVSGGWWLYAIRTDDATHPFFADYPKMAIWPDGLYMTANMFQGTTFNEVRAWAFNRTDLESGAPLRNVVMDLNTPAYGSLLPSNMRTVAGTPPAGRENILVGQSGGQLGFNVFKFHVDYSGSGSTLVGPTTVSEAAYTPAPIQVPTPGNSVASLTDRLMMQAQYSNHKGVESVWVNHTVGNPAGIQWAQINVTGGTINTTPVQQQLYAPGDGLNRWMGSLAVDRNGDMALGYSVANASTNPDIRYAGRTSFDPLGTLPQTETSMLSGVTRGTQVGPCGTQSQCSRWGDYSAMSIDPDGCRFWYAQEYYETTGLNWQTRIGSFDFPSCHKTDQEITFGPVANKTYGDADFTIGATASSSLAVSLTTSGPCTVSGMALHIAGVGSCTVNASQAGDATFNPALAVAQTFTIVKRPPCTVPKVVGKSLAVAKSALVKRGCRTGKVSKSYSSKVKKGRVISQGRSAGKKVDAGTKVNLVLSRGRKP